MKDKLNKIIKHYGLNNQLKYFQGEVFELTESIFQYEEQKRVCEQCCNELHIEREKQHITEEIADVLVMLEQFRLYYDIDLAQVKKIGKFKIDRQIERMKNDE